MNRIISLQENWREIAATWGGAAWLVLHQFGTPITRTVVRRNEIVQIEEADELRGGVESLPDGRILTLPMDGDNDLNRYDPSATTGYCTSLN